MCLTVDTSFTFTKKSNVAKCFFDICNSEMAQCTEMRFASFLSGGFITAIVVNPPERKLAKRTSVQWCHI